MPRKKPLAGVASFFARLGQDGATSRLSAVRELTFVAEPLPPCDLAGPKTTHEEFNLRIRHTILFPKSLRLGVKLVLDRLISGQLVKFT